MFPTDSQPPVEPNRDPNFVDARPAHQVIANPLPGYDYSRHPEAEAIHSGLVMKQINSGQPAAGMRIGVQMPKQPRPANIGIANAYAAPTPESYSLPEKFKEYDPHQAAQFSIPKSWGQGELTMNGVTSYAYSTPEETQNRSALADHILSQGEHLAHGRMLADSHDLLSRLAAGAMPNQQFGYNQEENAAAMQAVQQHMGSLLANDAQVHTANAQRVHNFDPRSNPQYMQAMISNMNAETERHLAQARADDPAQKRDLLHSIMSNPELAEAYGAVESKDMATMAQAAEHQRVRQQIGIQGVSRGNVGAYIGLPENRELQGIAQDQSLLPLERVTRALSLPGADDPGSDLLRAIDAMVHENWKTQDAWNDASKHLPDRPPNFWGAQRIFGPLIAGVSKITGDATGLGDWQKNHDLLQALRQAQQRTGYEPKY
jgi:hypothetical protein